MSGPPSPRGWHPEKGVPWEDKQTHWARAVGRSYAGDESALTRFVIMRPRKGAPDGRRAALGLPQLPIPWAPLWLHALWDVTTEDTWSDGQKLMVTPKALDRWAVVKAATDEDFRKALAVVYDEGGIPATAEFLVGLFVGR